MWACSIAVVSALNTSRLWLKTNVANLSRCASAGSARSVAIGCAGRPGADCQATLACAPNTPSEPSGVPEGANSIRLLSRWLNTIQPVTGEVDPALLVTTLPSLPDTQSNRSRAGCASRGGRPIGAANPSGGWSCAETTTLSASAATLASITVRRRPNTSTTVALTNVSPPERSGLKPAASIGT